MRKSILVAAALALATTASPALARQSQGYAVRSTSVLAGPDRRYPRVIRLRANAGLAVYGCLRDHGWCDVGYQSGRGWVPGGDIVISYRGRRRAVGMGLGITILGFSFGSYWDNYYRSQPFYAERPRWEHESNGYFGNSGGQWRGNRNGQQGGYGGNRGTGGWQQPVQPQYAPYPNGGNRGGGARQQPVPPQVAPHPDAPRPGSPARGDQGRGNQGRDHQEPGGRPDQRDHGPDNSDHQPHQ